MSEATTRQSPDVDSRRRILDAAFDLMTERGFSGTSISMICKRSGLPPSSTYWHFGSKEGVLAAVVEDAARRWLERVPRWGDIVGTDEQRVRTMFSSIAASIIDNPTPTRLLLLLGLERGQSLDADTLGILRGVRRSSANGFRLVFRELFGTETTEQQALCDELASFALAVADGAVIAQLLDESSDTGKMFEHLASAFLALGQHGVEHSLET